jgi:hypothetical protein
MMVLAALMVGASAVAATGAIDLTVGGGTVVPADRAGTIEYATVGLASFLADRHALGLRVALAPAGAPARDGSGATIAWSPSADYRAFLVDAPRVAPFFTAGLGFVLADRSAQGRTNLASMAGQVGLGLEARVRLRSGSWLTVAPAVGFAPGAFFGGGPFSIAAPIADLRIGMRSGSARE